MTKEIVKNLSTLGDIEIKFSMVTNKFYIVVDGLSVKRNKYSSLVIDIVEHEDSPEEAVKRYWERLTEYQIIVKNNEEYRNIYYVEPTDYTSTMMQEVNDLISGRYEN